jgi:hypothetical protein
MYAWRILRTQYPHLIAVLTFGLAGGVATTEGVQQVGEFLVVPGTALIAAAASELARVINNVAKEQRALTSDEQEKILRSSLKLRTLLEKTPGIPTSDRREQVEQLRKFEQLIRRRDITAEQWEDILSYLRYLEEDYTPKLEKYAQKYGSDERDLQ